MTEKKARSRHTEEDVAGKQLLDCRVIHLKLQFNLGRSS